LRWPRSFEQEALCGKYLGVPTVAQIDTIATTITKIGLSAPISTVVITPQMLRASPGEQVRRFATENQRQASLAAALSSRRRRAGEEASWNFRKKTMF
jgi:hypothetical protein